MGLQSPLAMNTDMGVVFDKAVEVVPRTPLEDTPPVVQVADRRILKLDHMTRNKSQALVSSLAGYRLDVNMLLRQHVEIGDTGYVYIVEIVQGVETAYRIADMQVEDIKKNTITKGIPIGSNIDFRDSPGGRIISMVSPSSSLEIISNEGEWQKARYQGREGYVFTEYISLQTVQEEIVTCRIFDTYETIDTDGWLGIHFEDK
ncbi:MAG TPA: SH3 domain-containing protein [candidate division Zixibacteria bacterium]|nr:SH3 domain-containing protein [candidate division Zixibacteria bacterium]